MHAGRHVEWFVHLDMWKSEGTVEGPKEKVDGRAGVAFSILGFAQLEALSAHFHNAVRSRRLLSGEASHNYRRACIFHWD